jgi:hypothetical protein
VREPFEVAPGKGAVPAHDMSDGVQNGLVHDVDGLGDSVVVFSLPEIANNLPMSHAEIDSVKSGELKVAR